MSLSPSYRTVTVPLAANEERSVNASGNILAVLSATGDFEMSFGDDTFFETEAGISYEPADSNGNRQMFKTLRFRDKSGAANSVKVQIGTGKIHDNRAVFGGASVPVTQQDTYLPREQLPNSITGSNWTVPAAGTYSFQATAGGFVTNRGVETIFATDSGLNAQRGIAIAPGETVDLKTSDLIYLVNTSSVDVAVTVLKRDWV